MNIPCLLAYFKSRDVGSCRCEFDEVWRVVNVDMHKCMFDKRVVATQMAV